MQHSLVAFLIGSAVAGGSTVSWSAPATAPARAANTAPAPVASPAPAAAPTAAPTGGVGPKDEEAKKLADEAIFTDYLATEFSAAQEKLVTALDICSADQCSASVIARIHRDLGVVLVAGLQDPENGEAELVLALKADRNITLDKDLATPELEAAFAQAKKEVTGAAAPPATGQQPAAGQRQGAAQQGQPGAAATPEADEVVCPPDFPGCGEDEEGFEGSFCDAASPCPEGYDCVDNKCEEVQEPIAEAPVRKNWLGLGVQQDFLLLSSGQDLCLSNDYFCFYQDTEKYYLNENGTIVSGPDAGDKLESAGAVPATTRVLVSFDRAVTNNVSVGARVGFAFRGGGPQAPGGKAFVSLHVEGRGTFWFGKGVFNKVGFRPFVFAGGGMAQVDAKVTVPAVGEKEDPDDPTKKIYTPFNLDAWRKTGLAFFSLGGGTGYAVSPGVYISAEVKLMQMVGANGTAAAAQLGAAYGF